MKRIYRGWILACLLLGALACTFGQAPLAPTPTELPQTVAPSATTTPLPPTATPQPAPTAITGLPVSFGGISFIIPDGLATGASGEIVPVSNDPQAPEWDRYPAYPEITLTGYQLADTFHNPQITVYSVAEYEALNPGIAQVVTKLQALIADPTQDFPSLPMLPVWNAAQMLHVQVVPVSFEGGRGVRYLAEYGQDVHPINNQGIFYTFQGLTDDGKYYVAVILPVSHPTLPADANLSGAEYDAFAQNFEAYLQDLTVALNAEASDSFSPSLLTLDALVQTLQIDLP